MTSTPPALVWALLDGLSGSNSQTRGVVRALGVPFAEHALTYAREWPWQRLAGRVRVTPQTRDRLLAAPPPRLIVTTGRRAGAVARWLKQALATRDGAAPRLLHIQDPRYGHDDFDRIIVPAHDRHLDRLKGRPNVTVVIGSPHPLTADRLEAAAEDWRAAVADLPRPRLAVLVGGDSGRRRLDAAVARRLAGQASGLARRAGGSLMVTTSRRTRPDALAALRGSLSGPHVLHAWTPDPAGNPYLGFLGLADAVIVTGDSMSMLTEATTNARPVYIFAPAGWARAPHARYHAQLVAAGAARMLDDATAWEDWTGVPINPAAAIATEARALLERA
jgi:mitochondrial fission protein ELM1